MSLTLRDIGTFMLKWNPIVAPFTIATEIAKSKAVQDTVKVSIDTTVKAAKAMNDGANKILDYDIEKGAKNAGDAIAEGVGDAYDYSAKQVGDAYDATAQTVGEVYDATGKAIDENVVKPVVNTGIAIDEGQKAARRGLADIISPD